MLQNLVTLKNPLRYMLAIFLLFFLLAYSYHGKGSLGDASKILLTVTSFVFGFYVNNLITQARNRHSKVVESLREEGGYIKAIYLILKSSFENNKVTETRDAIDIYLIAGMDYKVYDYVMSAPQFAELYNKVMNLKPENKQQDGGWGQIIRVIAEISKGRTRIETLVKERVSTFEWLTTYTLLTLVIYFIYTLNSGTLLSIMITASISTSLTMLLIVLYSLDSLRWKEDKWFWDPLKELFTSVNLIPYYPKILVDTGRVKLVRDQPVRLAEYPYPFPDMKDKRIILKG